MIVQQSGRYGPVSDWFERQGTIGWVVLVGAIAAMLLVGTYFERRTKKRADASWHGSAERLGLRRYEDIASGGDVLRGEIAGHQVIVEPAMTVRGKQAVVRTIYGALYRAQHGLDFKLAKNPTLKKPGGPRPIMVTHDPIFDAEVMITSTNDQAKLVDYLTAERRAALGRMFAGRYETQVTERHVHVITNELETHEERLVSAMRSVVDLVSILESSSSGDAAPAETVGQSAS